MEGVARGRSPVGSAIRPGTSLGAVPLALSSAGVTTLAVVGVVTGVVGIVLAIVFYVRGKREKRPTFSTQSVNIVKDLRSRVGQVEMNFHGEPIDTLTATKLAFWNAGRETINGADISEALPLLIVPREGVTILQVDLIYSNSDADEFVLSTGEKPGTHRVEFAYLDQASGGIFQVLHTGLTGEDVDLVGSIRGAKGIRRLPPGLGEFWSEMAANAVVATAFVLPTVAARFLPVPTWIKVVIWLALFAGGMFLGRKLMRRLNRRVPRGFEAFREPV
jgi:phosphate/sulfate permease